MHCVPSSIGLFIIRPQIVDALPSEPDCLIDLLDQMPMPALSPGVED